MYRSSSEPGLESHVSYRQAPSKQLVCRGRRFAAELVMQSATSERTEVNILTSQGRLRQLLHDNITNRGICHMGRDLETRAIYILLYGTILQTGIQIPTSLVRRGALRGC